MDRDFDRSYKGANDQMNAKEARAVSNQRRLDIPIERQKREFSQILLAIKDQCENGKDCLYTYATNRNSVSEELHKLGYEVSSHSDTPNHLKITW